MGLRLLVTVLVALLIPHSVLANRIPLLGTEEFRTDNLHALPKWENVLSRIDRERHLYAKCAAGLPECPSRHAVAWQALLREVRALPKIERVRKINSFLDGWRYRRDDQNYGRRDYWATPLEFLRHSGDCEDYAIAKYVSLRQVGFTPDEVRIVVVRDHLRDLAHAVVAVYIEGVVYILDNVTNRVSPQDRVTYYTPYYSVNENHRWAHVPHASDVEVAR